MTEIIGKYIKKRKIENEKGISIRSERNDITSEMEKVGQWKIKPDIKKCQNKQAC
jgi:hypothetical protein